MKLELIVVLAFFLIAGCARESQITGTTVKNTVNDGPQTRAPPSEPGKNVLFIIAQKDFRDEELTQPRAILEEAGHKVRVASPTGETATGMLGLTVRPDLAVKEANLDDYDMVVVVGGTGSPELANYPEVLNLISSAYDAGKPIGAICLGPMVLAKAGVLRGKRATVSSSAESLTALAEGGAVVTYDPVARDGNIITANGPGAATAFGNELARVLK